MAYTVGFLFFDFGSFYTAGFPTFSGILNLPPLGAPSNATSTTGPLALTFGAPPNPPGTLGSLLITDPSGPGDLFRSGMIASWPAEPVDLTAATVVAPIPFSSLAIPTPIDLPIHPGITVAIGAATGFLFSPFNIRLTSLVIGSSAAAPGTLRATFRGTVSYFTLFIPRRSDISGSVNLTLSPSGNAAVPTEFVTVTASNLSLAPGFITPLSTPLLALLAPAFSGALSGPLTTRVNGVIAPLVATARAMAPITPAGTPLFSAAATVSIRRISVLRSGIIAHVVLGELMARTVTAPPPGPGPGPGAGAADQLLVTINPQPEADVTHTYVVRVRRQLDQTPVEAADVSITTYNIIGTSLTITGQTDAQGLVALDATLRPKFRPSVDPTSTGQLDRTSPRLRVVKQGFQTFTQDLLPAP